MKDPSKHILFPLKCSIARSETELLSGNPDNTPEGLQKGKASIIMTKRRVLWILPVSTWFMPRSGSQVSQQTAKEAVEQNTE